MRDTRNENGFTLAELLIALMVTSVIFTSVATLAYAIGTAYQAGSATGRKQSEVRFASIRVLELIRQSKLIYSASVSEVVFWRDDDNNEQVGAAELVSIKTRLEGGKTQLCELVGAGEATVLIGDCANVQIRFDEPAVPVRQRRFVSISFSIVEDGGIRRYQISGTLRGWSGHLLDGEDNIVSDDD